MKRRIQDILFIFVATLLFSAGLKSCVIDAYKIPTGSMTPTLVEGDFLAVNKFIYGGRTPEKFLYLPLPQFRFPPLGEIRRGHVVVFEYPGDMNEVIPVRHRYLVKRCIALPGDTVSRKSGRIAVNGTVMEYFGEMQEDLETIIVPGKGMTVRVDGKNFFQWKVFIQREGSTITMRDGTAVIDGEETELYTVKRNYYYMVGDNIISSSDSREWGFVPEENIVGKAMLVYWSSRGGEVAWSRIGTVIR